MENEKDLSQDTLRRIFSNTEGYTSQFGAEGDLIQNLRYPANQTDIQNHYMILFVNEVLGGARLQSTKNRMISNETLSVAATRMAQGNSLAAKSAEGKAAIQKARAENEKESGVGAAVEGALLAPLSAIADFAISQYVRTKTVIVLPIPDGLEVSYSAQWGEENLTEGLIGKGMAVADALGKEGKVSDLLGKMAYNAMDSILGPGTGAMTKSANNPRKELLFSGEVDLREFQYTWKFFPKSPEDSKAVWDIIQMLKYHHLPELTNSNLYLQFPNLFDIEFYSYDKRNDWIPVTLSCALTNISVNYLSEGKASFFEMQPGQEINGSAPTAIQLNLTFKETEPLTRNVIDPTNDFTFNVRVKKEEIISGTSSNGEMGGMQGASMGSRKVFKGSGGGIY